MILRHISLSAASTNGTLVKAKTVHKSFRWKSSIAAVSKFPLDGPGKVAHEFSLHEFGVDDLLTLLPIVMTTDELPQMVVIGAQIGRIIPFTSTLSSPLEAVLDTTINLIQREIENSASPKG